MDNWWDEPNDENEDDVGGLDLSDIEHSSDDETINQDFRKLEHMNLDDILKIRENRQPNKFDLYRLNCLIVGKTGSGKTTTLLKILLNDAIDDYKLLMFIIPRESMESGFYKSLSRMTEDKLRKSICFIIIGEDDLPTVEEINQISANMKGPIALVLDDFINAFKKTDWLLFKRYVTQLSRVEYGCSLFALTQNLLEFPTPYRKNFNCFCLFVNSLTLLQFKEIIKSYYDYGNFNKYQLEELFNLFKKSSHTPLFLINNGEPEKSMLYGSQYINPDTLF
jgi:hypothetical protein